MSFLCPAFFVSNLPFVFPARPPGNVSGSYGDTASTQSFPLTVTVSFVNTNHQQLAGYAPPAPPVLFKVPYDVFYPFYMSPAAPSSSFSPAVMLAVLVVGALLGGGWSRR